MDNKDIIFENKSVSKKCKRSDRRCIGHSGRVGCR